MKIKIKKKPVAAGIAGVIVLALLGSGIYFWVTSNDKSAERENMPQMEGMGENVITASGLTATGMTEEAYELDFLETALYVEESYLSVGESVEAGTRVFKISEESMEEAREELERAETEAALAYRQGVIDYETQVLEAESTYRQAEINKEYAQAEYDNSLLQTKQEKEELIKQVEEAQALYDEYTAVVESDYYADYYQIDELKATYYDNFSYLMELYEKWDVEGLYDQYPNGGSSQGNANVSNAASTGNAASAEGAGNAENAGNAEGAAVPSGGGMEGSAKMGGASYDEGSSKLSVYEMMVELVDENGEEYEAAVENYEKDTQMAKASLEAARSNLATLQAELEEAELEYDKQVIAGKTDYETTLAESENAQTVYDTTVQKLEEDLETLKDEKEDAEENLAAFENTVGDGYFYTSSAGTVMMNMVRAGSYLSTDGILLAYSNPETVTVAASVKQADIAQISVGDSAYAEINGYGSYEGTVISIDPVSSSDSRSSVTYTVTVELSGDISMLESNLTAYVSLGMEEDREVMENEK